MGTLTASNLCQCGHSELVHAQNPKHEKCYVQGCACNHYTHDPEAKPVSYQAGGSGSYYAGGGGVWHGHSTTVPYVKCDHTPTPVIDGGKEGWSVYAGAKWDVQDEASKFDIIINCTGNTIFYNHKVPFDFYKDVPKSGGGEKECVLDWDDMSAPVLHPLFWKKLLDHLRATKSKALIFCIGGHGRTGTAVVSLLIAAGWGRKKALKWLRKNYCSKVVETDSQLKYLAHVEKTLRALDGKKVEDEAEEPTGSKAQAQGTLGV